MLKDKIRRCRCPAGEGGREERGMGAAGALPTGARTRADTRVFQDTDPAPGGIAVETHTHTQNE